jgi:two-component system NarL family sensor kinase
MDVDTRVRQLATLNALGEILNREVDFNRAVRPALEQLVNLVGLTTGWVFTTNVMEGDSHYGSFSVPACTGLPPALVKNDQRLLRMGGCECQHLLHKGQLERGVNMVTCSRLQRKKGDFGGLEIHASVPLLGQRGPVGILNLTAPGNTRFDEETLTFLSAIGKQLGTAFERSRLQEERTQEARYAATLEERQRLAQEMHDSVAQLLFAADLMLQTAQGQPDRAVQDRTLGSASENIQHALSELQSLVEVLRPVDLTHGLKVALSRLAKRTTGGGMTVHLDAEEVDLNKEVADGLYRITQEAVHNALRHSHGQNIWLRIRRGTTRIVLEVEDDGRGFNLRKAGAGIGLEGMRDRARALGGTLRLYTRPEEGCRVRVEVLS